MFHLTSWKKWLLAVFLCAGLFFMLCAGIFLYEKESIEKRAGDYIISELDRMCGGQSSIAAVRVQLFPIQLIIRGLTIQKITIPPSTPILSIKEVRLRPRWRSLFQRLRFKSVDLEAPRITVLTGFDGETNVPEPKIDNRDMELFRVVIDRLKVRGGFVRLENRRLHLDTEVSNFSLQAQHRSFPRSYRVSMEYHNGSLQFDKFTCNHNLKIALLLLENEARIEKLIAEIDNARLEMTGTVRDFRAPQGALDFHGVLPLKALRQFHSGIHEFGGDVENSGHMEFGPQGWRVEGALSGVNLTFGPAKINQASCKFSLSPSRIDLDRIEISGLHGRAEGSLSIDAPFQTRRFAADLGFKDFSLRDLLTLVGQRNIPLAGAVSGTIQASWADQWKGFTGNGRLQFAEAARNSSLFPAGTFPISGQLNFALTQWSSSFDNSYLRIGDNRLEFTGTLSPEKISDLRLEFESADLSKLPFPVPGLEGHLRFSGMASGSISTPRLSGTLSAGNLRYRTSLIDRLTGRISASRDSVELMDMAATRKESLVVVEGTIPLDPRNLVPAGASHLRLRIKENRTEGLMEMAGLNLPAGGLLSGDFTASGEWPLLSLKGIAQIRKGWVSGQSFDYGRVEFEYRHPVLTLASFSVQLGSGQLKGSARMNLVRKEIRTDLLGSNLPLARVRVPTSEPFPLGGLLKRLVLKANGPFQAPSVEGQVDLKGLELFGEPAGDFQTSLTTRNQVVQFTTLSETVGGHLEAKGTVGLEEGYRLNSKIVFNNFAFGPYLRRFLIAAPEALTSQASGELSVSGSLRHPDQMQLTGVLTAMQMNFRETSLQAAKPFNIHLEGGALSILGAAFSGKGTTLNLDGSLQVLGGNKRINLELGGGFDLALISEFSRKVSAKGSGTVNATVRGTLADPQMKGYADINAELLASQDFPNSLSQVTGRIFFDENQINLTSLTGSSGGGKVRMSGNVVFSQATVKLINLKIEAREVRVRYPEGMRNVVDADLNLRGSQRSHLLDGNIRLLSASFQKDYDPITEFLTTRNTRVSVPGGRDVGNALNLDLSITSDRSIRLDTSLARITSRADLRVKGTPANPLLTGSIEASGGEIYFQGARYRITRGRIDFVNPTRLDPRLDLEAETDLRDYRIVLTIIGTAEKFRADLRSDPPLSTMELFSLVSAGGTGAGAVTGSSPRPFSTAGRQQDASLGATSLLSEGLSLKMGSRVKQIFGLDRFRVEPPAFLLGNTRDPAARVTFGQQVSRELSVTYSTSVSTNEQQVILVEYNINDSTSIIASRDSEGAFGLDVRFRKRLRQGSR
jgi:translocation and assembly module TamB